ncbi:hypothetical protein [Herminiimonas sp. CN]|uniref:hypothetical protein n=1 Tax=Herminiimonas sp. CN TaxID=1349818 RepID=UPI0012DDF491|nr:hypothetical protein [Herminiimonas sp. CN]
MPALTIFVSAATKNFLYCLIFERKDRNSPFFALAQHLLIGKHGRTTVSIVNHREKYK